MTAHLSSEARAEAEGASEPISALMQRHWLVFGRDGQHVVVGCNCGFQADLDADCGYGDSVVRHLLEVGRG